MIREREEALREKDVEIIDKIKELREKEEVLQGTVEEKNAVLREKDAELHRLQDILNERDKSIPGMGKQLATAQQVSCMYVACVWICILTLCTRKCTGGLLHLYPVTVTMIVGSRTYYAHTCYRLLLYLLIRTPVAVNKHARIATRTMPILRYFFLQCTVYQTVIRFISAILTHSHVRLV